MSAFTVGRLHKLLGQLVEQGHARKPVAVYKTTFTDPCEADGHVVLNVYDADLQYIPVGDGDGSIATNKDGSERYRVTLVLTGGTDPEEQPCKV